MSVELGRLFADRKADYSFGIPIADEQFFVSVWEKARKELKLTLFYDGSEFTKEKIGVALSELSELEKWANNNLTGNDLTYMLERIQELNKIIPNAFPNGDEIIYLA